MLLLCKKCSYPNLPTGDVCGRCGNATQTPEELAQGIQFWNGLPDQVQMEFKQKYQSAQEGYTKRSLIRRGRRWKDALLGGSALSVAGLINGPLVIVDFVVGAVMGLILNITGGGSFTGTLLFGLGYFISFAIKGMLGFVWGNVITLMFGLVVGICAGYFVGLALDIKRSDDI